MVGHRLELHWDGTALTIIGIAIASMPVIGAFEEPNAFIPWFPFIWLPGFVAPFALFLHVMSLRQLFRSLKRP